MPKQSKPNIDGIRHSLSHLLATTVLKKFPKAKLGIGPTIENGFYYDFLLPRTLTPNDLKEFEKEIKKLIAANLPFSGKKITPAEGKKLFKDQPFKLDLIKEFIKEKKQLTVYKTGEVFLDLCGGGHVKNSKEINPEAFKLTKIAGAYWRGDEKNPQLQRIYGVAFITKKEMADYFKMQEEAEKRDHRKLGERLKLFTFSKEVGPGLPLWLPNGTIVREELEKYARQVEKDWGYQYVTTPHIAKEDLFRISGHIPYYEDSMYPPMALDDGNYYLKPMNCSHTHMIYRAEQKSYRDLPLRLAEFGTVYRYELSGTLAGLLRVRGFTQNDAHIYCREDQVEKEFLDVMKLHEFWYKKIFGLKDFYMRLSLPAKSKTKYVSDPKGWEKAVKMIRAIMKKSKLPYEEVGGEAAFYGPKVDFQIKSVIGREETASTNQLDFLASKRFKLTYKDKDGKDKPVYVIHRAPLGSHERFIAFLIEHFAGAFPLWLSPVQIEIINVGANQKKYAEEISKILKLEEFRVRLGNENLTVGKKIREAEMNKIPYIIVVGETEQKNRTVNIRHYRRGQGGEITIDKLIEKIHSEINSKAI